MYKFFILLALAATASAQTETTMSEVTTTMAVATTTMAEATTTMADVTTTMAEVTTTAGGGGDGDCDWCASAELVSEDGFADEWSRYIGTWEKKGLYNGKAFYQCIADCEGLDDQLVYADGRWEIVDCFPDSPSGCNGVHEILYSQDAPIESCPGDDIGPWTYCDGNFIPGGGCDSYAEDPTAGFICT